MRVSRVLREFVINLNLPVHRISTNEHTRKKRDAFSRVKRRDIRSRHFRHRKLFATMPTKHYITTICRKEITREAAGALISYNLRPKQNKAGVRQWEKINLRIQVRNFHSLQPTSSWVISAATPRGMPSKLNSNNASSNPSTCSLSRVAIWSTDEQERNREKRKREVWG